MQSVLLSLLPVALDHPGGIADKAEQDRHYFCSRTNLATELAKARQLIDVSTGYVSTLGNPLERNGSF